MLDTFTTDGRLPVFAELTQPPIFTSQLSGAFPTLCVDAAHLHHQPPLPARPGYTDAPLRIVESPSSQDSVVLGPGIVHCAAPAAYRSSRQTPCMWLLLFPPVRKPTLLISWPCIPQPFPRLSFLALSRLCLAPSPDCSEKVHRTKETRCWSYTC